MNLHRGKASNVTMRTTLGTIVLAGLVLAAAPARADTVAVAGRYDVKFEEVSTNCTTQQLQYKPMTMDVKTRGNGVVIDLDLTPLMTGSQQKTGKLSAKSKPGNTMIDGMSGVFSVAGHVGADGAITLVMVAEYSDAKANKPLCTQSWNVTGMRSTGTTPPNGSVKQSQPAFAPLDL